MSVAYLILQCLSSPLQAQEPYFIERDLDQRFSDMQIHVLFQDINCLVWIGTSDGLMQYNGFELEVTPPPDSSFDAAVTAIAQDGQDGLWVGTASGMVYKYHYGVGPEMVEIGEGWPETRITGFATTDTVLWIATYGEGLFCHDGHHLYNFNMDDGMLGNDIYAITTDHRGSVWVGTDGGINACRFTDFNKSVRSYTIDDGLPDQIVKAVQSDNHGNIWVGTHSAGICYYDVARDSFHTYVHDERLGSVVEFAVFEDLELWVGTETNGLWRYTFAEGRLAMVDHTREQSGGRINDLLIDAEGNLWVSSNTNNLFSAYRPFEHLIVPIGHIQALYADRSNRVWIGTAEGLYYLSERSIEGEVQAISAHEGLNITTIAGDTHGNLWLGTLDAGVFIYHPDHGLVLHLDDNNSVLNNTVMSIIETPAEIWIAAIGGVVKFDARHDIRRDQGQALEAIPELSNSFMYSLFADSEGRVWVGTEGLGAIMYDGRTTQIQARVSDGDSVAFKTVYSFAEDHQGDIWLSTAAEGLFRYDGEGLEQLTLEDGLTTMRNTGLVTARNGDILIIHPNGIDVMKPRRRHFMYFDDEIGIHKLVPGLNTTTTDTTGFIWIGSRNTILRYHPLNEELSIHPRTQLTRVSVGLKPVDYHHINQFAPSDRYFSFDYIGLWYTSPKSVKYLYKLEGYDVDWKESQDHLASYSNLRPGEYTFHVKASENQSFHDEPLASYHFAISKPIWQRWWFIILAVLALSGLLYLLVKVRERRSQRDALLKKEKIESQFLALKAQINPHFLFNSFNTLITIIDEDPKVAVTYVEQLSDFYRSILQYREKETIPLEDEIGLVRSYCFLLQQRFGDSLDLEVNVEADSMAIPPLTLQLLVENAVKHNIISQARPLKIEITTQLEGYVTVRNNLQKKTRPVASTKFGLQSIINRYQLLSDKKVIVDESQAFFNVSVPLVKQN